MVRSRRIRWLIGVLLVFGAAPAGAADTATWYTNSWKAAQAHAGFPLRYPKSVFNLRPLLTNGKLISVTPCAAPHSTGRAVWAQWGPVAETGHHRVLWIAQTNVKAPGWPCSNQGIAGLVKTVSIRGHKTYITAYCSPAVKPSPAPASKPPPCSSRWVSFDLTWHERKAWIRVEGYGFHTADLVRWARALKPVG